MACSPLHPRRLERTASPVRGPRIARRRWGVSWAVWRRELTSGRVLLRARRRWRLGLAATARRWRWRALAASGEASLAQQDASGRPRPPPVRRLRRRSLVVVVIIARRMRVVVLVVVVVAVVVRHRRGCDGRRRRHGMSTVRRDARSGHSRAHGFAAFPVRRTRQVGARARLPSRHAPWPDANPARARERAASDDVPRATLAPTSHPALPLWSLSRSPARWSRWPSSSVDHGRHVDHRRSLASHTNHK